MSTSPRIRTLRYLRNTRDLRAEIISLAAELTAADQIDGRLVVENPVLTEETIGKEWATLLPALAPEVRTRMHLEIVGRQAQTNTDAVALPRPNYRHEVLRMLIEANLRNEKVSIKEMVGLVGASQTPVRAAIEHLRSAGLVKEKGSALQIRPEDISTALLAKAGALPTTLRFRFETGARIKPPAQLLERCMPLLHRTTNNQGWGRMALSGVAAITGDAQSLDIMGLPRLDLLAQVPPQKTAFSIGLLKQLDDGLEQETRVLEAAPVVVTVVRAKLMRAGLRDATALAPASDVFMSLLDMGLRNQALQFIKAARL